MAGFPVKQVSNAVALDERPARWRIGVIALATDHTTERDFYAICPADEVGVYVSRVVNENPISAENLRAMQPRLQEAAALILPTLIARAAGESFIGRRVRRTPSNSKSAPATAPAVGTSPISPTPLMP